jgi:hypothetical protein
MPFIKNYKEAFDVLKSIETGKCAGRCRRIWMTNLKNALKTKTNPLKLTMSERKNMTKKMNSLKGKRININKTQKPKTQKNQTTKKTKNKYKIRNSPPYSANENCNKIMIGNDGKKYKSVPNKNGVCTWRKI